MGYNARNDEIRDNVTRMQREWEAQRVALATVRRFNAIMSVRKGNRHEIPDRFTACLGHRQRGACPS
jgi:hypothetical protein